MSGKSGIDGGPETRRKAGPGLTSRRQTEMAKLERKGFDKPEETRSVDKGTIEVVKLGDVTAMRVRFAPGWRWSECVKPIANTPSCQVAHLMHVVSGRMGVRMDDGTEVEFGAGDVGTIPPGHDAWIVGNDSFVGIDFQGGSVYAKPSG
jgi:mannose-6-phosphate isomerase-like protein (cupin superfamily)